MLDTRRGFEAAGPVRLVPSDIRISNVFRISDFVLPAQLSSVSAGDADGDSMRPCRGNLLTILVLATLVAGWPLGCSMPSNPWRFADPPTKGTSARPIQADVERSVIVVVAPFDDPSRAPNYSRGVGQAMSDAYSRALIRKGGYQVRINEQLAAEARRFARFDASGSATSAGARTRSTRSAASSADLSAERQRARDQLGRDREDVDYVIIGKVTDFYHTRDLPNEASRWGFIGRRNEAIVSVDLRVVDMQTMRVVGTDHLMGTANAGRTDSRELYENVALDSYLFWNTPLGRAGRRAIDRAVNRSVAMMHSRPVDRASEPPMLAEADALDDETNDEEAAPVNLATRSAPPPPESRTTAAPRSRFANARPQILRVDDSRRVTIMGGRNIGVEQGDRFHIAREVGVSSADGLVNDAVTGRPIRIAITDVAETTSTGWLLGQKPRQLDLRGMLLHLPDTVRHTAAAQIDADAGGSP